MAELAVFGLLGLDSGRLPPPPNGAILVEAPTSGCHQDLSAPALVMGFNLNMGLIIIVWFLVVFGLVWS